ncbi:MAG: WD40 repeat domain-containing protein [Spirochaetaceae bacterium]|jgi:hypothetical protein|nr:WD40 repeat domain-containing protein [Spirochaetaceae bacterium]
MPLLKPKYRIIFWCVVFIVYAFFAARPVSEETTINMKWLRSLESSYSTTQEPRHLIPWRLGERFGYFSPEGEFSINQIKTGHVLLSPNRWMEFSGRPSQIEIKTAQGATELVLENPEGYPFFADDEIYIMHSEQSAVSLLDKNGAARWRYDFASLVTVLDAAAGYTLAGLLDGSVELIDNEGRRVFFSEPSGSRLASVYGCVLSGNGDKMAIVSGRDDQRFVFIEDIGGTRRITYHEFLGDGFNRRVRMAFINGGRLVVFERKGGVGIYDTVLRVSSIVRFEGQLLDIEEDGSEGLIFLLAEEAQNQKKLLVLDSRGKIIVSAPFFSEKGYLEREGNALYIGGGGAIAAFDIDIH